MVFSSTVIETQHAKLALLLPTGAQTLWHSSFRNSNERFQDSTSFINLAQLIPRQVTRDGRTMSPCCGLLKKKKKHLQTPLNNQKNGFLITRTEGRSLVATKEGGVRTTLSNLTREGSGSIVKSPVKTYRYTVQFQPRKFFDKKKFF